MRELFTVTDRLTEVSRGAVEEEEALFAPVWPSKYERKFLDSSWCPRPLTTVKHEEDSLCPLRAHCFLRCLGYIFRS